MIELPVITIDTDWAPDFAINEMAAPLLKGGVKATWFITHNSKAIEKLSDYPELFELGIHPNFLPNSTQGKNPTEILSFLTKLAPNARSMRTHSLVQSTPLLRQIMAETRIINDVSLYLHHCPDLRGHRFYINKKYLNRYPYFWEDDMEMETPDPCWETKPLLELGQGLKIFNFHPMYFYLNCTNLNQGYNELKQGRWRLHQVPRMEADKFRRTGIGPQSMFNQLCSLLSSAGGGYHISDLAEMDH